MGVSVRGSLTDQLESIVLSFDFTEAPTEITSICSIRTD
ncbi:hypothetical protein ACHAWO_009078 [Cyclotella atomus]|uniref:Uncharacterized protein n=1 Tax=Cyclotella atomus TaxID=382360 RepID=A0ABD3QAX0_9STRA